MCPLAVAINFGKYLLMSCDMSPGEVAKNPRSMAWSMYRGWDSSRLNGYCDRSFLVRILYTLDATGMVEGSGLGAHLGPWG